MRLVTSVMLALCVALPAPIVANASESVNPVHKHRIYQQLAVTGWFNPAATALVPAIGFVRAAPALKSNDNADGLSRDRDQCNRGCIDN
jgi:hypothetical protein